VLRGTFAAPGLSFTVMNLRGPFGGRSPVAEGDRSDLARLVPAAQAGDVLALEALLAVLEPYVARLVAPIVLRDAADATQESLVLVLRNPRRLQEPAALFSWARTIAVRQAVQMARLTSKTGVTPVDAPAHSDEQLAADIYDVLDRMTPEHRAVLVLRDIEGLDERAASRLLDLPQGTVKSRLARARAAFRKAWQQ
jgi:RNA polymerase sigma factor (sigma-70 family)